MSNLLYTTNRVDLPCEHIFYCLDCIENWFQKTRVGGGISLLPIIEHITEGSKGIWKFPVYYQDRATFPCPTCRSEHTFLHQSREHIKHHQPKKVIAKVHFGDLLDRDPVFPIIDISELYCLIPKKYVNSESCCTLNPFTSEQMKLPSSIVYIIYYIMPGINAGDTGFCDIVIVML